MSYASQAAEDLKTFVKRIEPLLAVGKALEEIGSLEQAASEALKRKEEAYAECKKIEEVLLKKQEEHHDALKLIDIAKSKAELIVSNAHGEVEKMIGKAKQESLGIIERANQLKQEAAKSISESNNLKSEASAFVEQKKVELAAVKKQIEEGRALIASFMKGK